MPRKSRKGGCACGGKRTKKRGGSFVGDAVLAGTAVGLYTYFKKKGGRLPARRTRRGLV